jgi:uridylate kinase
MNKTYIVIKIGGSLLFRKDNKIDSQKIEDFCNIIKTNNRKEYPLIVVGGGAIARDYIEFVRKYTNNEALCDLFGIEISRLNAKLFISYLEDLAYPLVPNSIEELAIAQLSNKIIVMGGLQPGQSTTSVALEVAEFLKAKKAIVLTDVDGVFDKDPHKYKDATLLEKINYNQLTDLIIKDSHSEQAAAGEYRIFDVVSLQILKRSKIEVMVGSGLNLKNFERLWKGKLDNIGTIISN